MSLVRLCLSRTHVGAPGAAGGAGRDAARAGSGGGVGLRAGPLADLLECAYSPPAAEEGSLERVRELGEFSADQVGFTLGYSRSYAHAQVLLAQDLIERLPAGV